MEWLSKAERERLAAAAQRMVRGHEEMIQAEAWLDERRAQRGQPEPAPAAPSAAAPDTDRALIRRLLGL